MTRKRRLEHARQAVADHRAAAMAHVQRPGRVGRDIFDVDALVVADRGGSVRVAVVEDRPKLVAPGVGIEPEVDETRPGNLDGRDRRHGFEPGLDRLGKRARVHARRLGQDHRRIGRQVPVRRVARRLDRHVLAVEVARQRAVGDELVEHPVEERGILGVEAHEFSLARQRAPRSSACSRACEGRR